MSCDMSRKSFQGFKSNVTMPATKWRWIITWSFIGFLRSNWDIDWDAQKINNVVNLSNQVSRYQNINSIENTD